MTKEHNRGAAGPGNRISVFRFVQESARAVSAAIGAITLTPEQRGLYKGKWFGNAFEFGLRAAQCRDRHPNYLGDMRFTGGDIRDAFQEADDAEAYYLLLQKLARGAADIVLKKRARAHGMAIGVMQRLQALLANAILDENARKEMEASLRRLRREFERRGKKVGKNKLSAEVVIVELPDSADLAEASEAPVPERPAHSEEVEEPARPAQRSVEKLRNIRAAGKRGRKPRTSP